MDSLLKSVRRLGKQTFSFNYVLTIDSLIIECDKTKRWYPSLMVIAINRSSRKFFSRQKNWKPGVACPFRSVIVWSEPETIEFSLTLYKYEASCEPFEEKVFEFTIYEDHKSGFHRELAKCSVDLSIFATPLPTLHTLNLRMIPVYENVVSCQLDVKLFTVLIQSFVSNNMEKLISIVPFKNNPAFDDAIDLNSSVSSISKSLLNDNNNQFTTDISSIASIGVPLESQINNNSLENAEKLSHGSNEQSDRNSTDDKKLLHESQIQNSCNQNNSIGSHATYLNQKYQIVFGWCKTILKNNTGSQFTNFTTSWKSGILFCQLIHHYFPEKINIDNLSIFNGYSNLNLAFNIFKDLKIPLIIKLEHFDGISMPDPNSMLEFLAVIKEKFLLHEATKKILISADGILANSNKNSLVEKSTPLNEENDDESLKIKNIVDNIKNDNIKEEENRSTVNLSKDSLIPVEKIKENEAINLNSQFKKQIIHNLSKPVFPSFIPVTLIKSEDVELENNNSIEEKQASNINIPDEIEDSQNNEKSNELAALIDEVNDKQIENDYNKENSLKVSFIKKTVIPAISHNNQPSINISLAKKDYYENDFDDINSQFRNNKSISNSPLYNNNQLTHYIINRKFDPNTYTKRINKQHTANEENRININNSGHNINDLSEESENSMENSQVVSVSYLLSVLKSFENDVDIFLKVSRKIKEQILLSFTKKNPNYDDVKMQLDDWKTHILNIDMIKERQSSILHLIQKHDCNEKLKKIDKKLNNIRLKENKTFSNPAIITQTETSDYSITHKNSEESLINKRIKYIELCDADVRIEDLENNINLEQQIFNQIMEKFKETHIKQLNKKSSDLQNTPLVQQTSVESFKKGIGNLLEKFIHN